MLEHAYYSVISPEGCAGILWKSHSYAEQAAKALRMRSSDLISFGVLDDVIEEPLGGAHRDHHQMASRLKMYLLKCLRELTPIPADKLVAARYQKFRRDGQVSGRLRDGFQRQWPGCGSRQRQRRQMTIQKAHGQPSVGLPAKQGASSDPSAISPKKHPFSNVR